jgi:hypothetical protein
VFAAVRQWYRVAAFSVAMVLELARLDVSPGQGVDFRAAFSTAKALIVAQPGFQG